MREQNVKTLPLTWLSADSLLSIFCRLKKTKKLQNITTKPEDVCKLLFSGSNVVEKYKKAKFYGIKRFS